MINRSEILQTIAMIDQQHLDIRTITMGISLLDCADTDIRAQLHEGLRQDLPPCAAISCAPAKISRPSSASRSSTSACPSRPSALVGAGTRRAVLCAVSPKRSTAPRAEIGVNFIGGFSALVHKGYDRGRPRAHRLHPGGAGRDGAGLLERQRRLDASAGINMDAVRLDGRRSSRQPRSSRADQRRHRLRQARRVLPTPSEDNPFMAGAFHGVGEPECVINVGVSGPGVVQHALAKRARASRLTWWRRPSKRRPSSITRMGQLVAQEASRAAGRAVRHCGSVAGADARRRRQRGRTSWRRWAWRSCGTHGTTAALALLNDAVKKGGVMASSHVGGLSGAFIPVSARTRA